MKTICFKCEKEITKFEEAFVCMGEVYLDPTRWVCNDCSDKFSETLPMRESSSPSEWKQ
jgi:hypothetical protein